MALRVLLVALVMAMGLELPEVTELAGWERSARDWVAARVADLSSLGGDEIQSESKTETEPGRADLVFEAVSEAMASEFSTDLALPATKPVESVAASAEPEPEFVPEVTTVPTLPDPRTERITEAVRLTRQAVGAWASLIQATADRSPGEDGSVDSF